MKWPSNISLKPKMARNRMVGLLVLALSTLVCTSARAQSSPTIGFQKVLNRAFEKGNLMVALSAVDWRPGLSLAATRLPSGETRTLELTLRQNINYAFIATSGNEVTDVDLYLLDAEGNVLVKDQESDGTPILEFRVSSTGNYRVQVHVAASNTISNFVALSLLQSSGQPVIEGDYRLLNNRFFTASQGLLSATESLRWLDDSDNWSILGFSVQNNEPVDLSNLRLPPNRYQIAGSADLQFRNLFLYLANMKGEIVAQSNAKTPFPFLEFQVANSQPQLLRILPKGPQASGLLLIGFFQH